MKLDGEEMTLYEKFERLSINTSCIGLQPGDATSEYFCEPKGATIIGWEGVDGIHYCRIRGFGDMVFAVNPMGSKDKYVYPLASSFEDFLCLLLACGSSTAIEQIHNFNEEQFHTYMEQDVRSQEQVEVLEQIKNAFGLSAMEDPFQSVKNLQESFDYSQLKFSKEYYETVDCETDNSETADCGSDDCETDDSGSADCETDNSGTEDCKEDDSETVDCEKVEHTDWNVFFDVGFWGGANRNEAGKEIVLNRDFIWDDVLWKVPAIYVCGDGIVVDFCVQIDVKEIQTFVEKWNKAEQRGSLTNEEREILEAKNPLNFDVEPSIFINGRCLRWSSSSSTHWIPYLTDGMENNQESELLCDHYNCDKTYGWRFLRASFSWERKRKPMISAVSLLLRQQPRPFTGPHFVVDERDRSLSFIHPITGKEHTLVIMDQTSQTLPPEHFIDKNYEYPCYYELLSYKITPDLSEPEFVVRDCDEGDSLRLRNQKDCFLPTSTMGVAIAVIGGSSGPTVIWASGKSTSEERLHTACSSLYFGRKKEVEWRITFYERMREDLQITLL